jgi:hypothetical protein
LRAQTLAERHDGNKIFSAGLANRPGLFGTVRTDFPCRCRTAFPDRKSHVKRIGITTVDLKKPHEAVWRQAATEGRRAFFREIQKAVF